MDRSEALWVAAAILVLPAFPLVFGNAFYEATRGRNEEIGVALALAGAALALVGVWLRRGRGVGAKTAAVAAGVILVAPVVWFVAATAMAPYHDEQRTLTWERLAEDRDAPPVDAASLPADVVAALRATQPGDRGALTMPVARYEAVFETLMQAAIPPERVVRLDEGTYEFFPPAVM